MSRGIHESEGAAGKKFDPHIWKIPFWENAPTPWLCARCHKGRLVPKKITFYDRESADSLRLRKQEEWNNNWYEGRFSGILECENASCGDVAAVAGRSAFGLGWDKEGEEFEYSELHPGMIHPAPWIIPLPDMLSKRMRDMLLRSFASFWSDPAATIFRIRIVLEVLLRRPASRSATEGKASPLSPSSHRSKSAAIRRTEDLLLRLEWFADQNPEAKEDVLAVMGSLRRFWQAPQSKEEALLFYGVLHRVMGRLFV